MVIVAWHVCRRAVIAVNEVKCCVVWIYCSLTGGPTPRTTEEAITRGLCESTSIAVRRVEQLILVLVPRHDDMGDSQLRAVSSGWGRLQCACVDCHSSANSFSFFLPKMKILSGEGHEDARCVMMHVGAEIDITQTAGSVDDAEVMVSDLSSRVNRIQFDYWWYDADVVVEGESD